MKKKKKKQGRNLVLGLLVLAALLVVYFVLDYQQKQEQAASETEAEVIELPVSVTEEEFAKVSIKTAENTMTFRKETEGEEVTWVYEEDSEFPLNATLVNTKMQSLTDPGITRLLENPEDISEYGLDAPLLEVTVEKTDGSSYVLYIGDKNATNSDYYLMVDGYEEIYTFDGGLVGALNIDPYDVATGEELPTIEETTVTRFKIEQESGTYEFVSDEATGLVWTMIAPDGTESAVDSTALDSLKAAVAGIGFDAFIDYKGEDLAKYGLDEPTAVITVEAVETEVVEIEAETKESESGSDGESETSNETEAEVEPETEIVTIEKKVVLLVGDMNEDGNYYVKEENSPQVHIIAASELESVLNIQRVDYVDTYINDVPFSDIKSLKVTYEGETIEFVKEEEIIEVEAESESEGEETTEEEPETEIDYHYMAGDVEYSSDYFIMFYNNTILLRAERRMEEEDCPEVTGDPELILEYTRLDGSTQKSEYYPGSDGMYLVLSDQGLPAKVDKFDVQAVIESYTTMLTDGVSVSQ